MFSSIKAFVIIVLIFNVLIRADQFGKEPAYCNEGYVLRRRLGSTDRNISVERSLLDWHFPNFVTTLTELELHKHQDHGSLKYFELGVGNGKYNSNFLIFQIYIMLISYFSANISQCK